MSAGELVAAGLVVAVAVFLIASIPIGLVITLITGDLDWFLAPTLTTVLLVGAAFFGSYTINKLGGPDDGH